MKSLLKKIIPASILKLYHFTLAILAALLYRFPSNEIVVIGVTGTGGKSTTVKMISKILEQYGAPVGWLSSLTIKTGNKEIINPFHMTMLGRFKLQKKLREMVNHNKHYAVLEVTSEGIKQFRHLGINFDVVVFTNLSPEHIEAHGSFENYRNAKLKIFKNLTKHKRKHLSWIDDNPQDKIIVANLDDENAIHFINNKADQIYTFSLNNSTPPKNAKIIKAREVQVKEKGSTFKLDTTKFQLNLLGKFNVYNALAAITTVRSLGIDFLSAKKALLKINKVEGRMEKIKTNKDFNIVIDLAHTPDSLEQAYKTLKKSYFLVPGFKNMICVLGSAGGVRDKWKRPALGEIAAKYCDKIYLTNEDPYEEDPQKILSDIEKGVKKKSKKLNEDYFKIKDRRKAIRAALQKADKGDLVVLTGKGTEATMVIGNKKIPWNEKDVVREELKKQGS